MLLLVVILPAICAEVRLSVSAAHGQRNIEVGSLFYITMEVVNLDATPEKPTNVPGANVVYFDRTGSSSSFSSINGKTTRSSSYTWTITLRAKSEGSFTYGPITVGGVKSNSVKYNIGKSGSNNTGQNSQSQTGASQDRNDDGKPKYIGHGDQNLFLRANVTKSSVYEQEALVYTVKLYTSYDAVKFIGATSAPKFDGFVIEESKDISNQLSYETYEGKSYATAVIARYIIFPQMTGKLKVTGNTYTISVDRREYYHDPFWGNIGYSQPLQLNVKPNDLIVNVNPLPEPRPVDFSGGVGIFTISSNLKGNEFKTNRTASIVYTISGTGNIKYVQMPDLGTLFPPQLEIYTPTSTQNVQVGSANVNGNVQFDYSFMPLEEGVFKIPDVKFVYFNTESNRYETTIAKGYEITVEKGKGSTKSQVRKQLRFDSELQVVKADKLSEKHVPYVYKFVYWLWFILPAFILAASVFGYYYYLNQHADMAAFNSRRADKLARRRLRRAATAMKKKDRDLFYDELLKALWGYLGDKLKMPNSELMRDNIRQVLTDKGVEDGVIDHLIDLIDEAEFAKYSSAGGESSMERDYRTAINAINEMEDSFKKSKNGKA